MGRYRYTQESSQTIPISIPSRVLLVLLLDKPSGSSHPPNWIKQLLKDDNFHSDQSTLLQNKAFADKQIPSSESSDLEEEAESLVYNDPFTLSQY